jgi:hypothetical protein
MTKRWLLIPAFFAAALTVYATASTAAAPTATVERYYVSQTWHEFADVGKRDNGGPADIYVSQQTIKRLDGETAGVLNGYGVNLHPPFVFFHWTASLPGGTLTVEGAVNLHTKSTAYAIEGGTGRFAGARGTVTLADAGSKGSLATVRYTRHDGK